MPFPRQTQGLRPQLHSAPLGANAALHSSIVRYASHSNKHKKSQAMRDSQEKHHSDSNEPFGRRQKPFWRSITPDFLRQEMEALSGKAGRFAQVSSFKMHASHKVGSKPVVEASSTSWDSKTNEVKHSVYDPVSGRMVPATNGQSRQTSTSARGQGDNHVPVKPYQKPTVLSQLPTDAQGFVNTPTAHAAFTEDFEKSYASEHEELLAARRHLDTLREQVQILERQVHPELTKPDDILDAERPAVFEDGWDSDPKGLQTAFEHEKEACEHGDMKPLEQEMAALNKEPVQGINDDYSISPSGMETLFAHEQEVDDIAHTSSLETELAAMNSQAPPLDDGYSASPKGLQTLFDQEQQETEHGQRQSLEEEVKLAGSPGGQVKYEDGYGTEPIGLETMYDKEQQGRPEQLEHELGSLASDPTVRDPDDAYSTEPSGLQTLYEREEAESQRGQRQDLEHELHDQLHARPSDDGFSTRLEGMQTLWQREQERVEQGSAKSLEEEIQARQQPAMPNDGLSTAPFGMQTHFSEESQDTAAGRNKTLEEELNRKVEAETYDDGYPPSPVGLQMAFDKEEKEANLGRRPTLEKEMNTREPAFEDGYSNMPMGLQMMFRREKHDAAKGNRRSLEEDIKQMEAASYHEDGYSRAPIGMENSFDRETKAGSNNFEAELKSMPGEGDLSPTVGKFATSDKWYKQPARSTFSEDILKADIKERIHDTAFAQGFISQKSQGLTEPNVPPQAKPAAQAELPLAEDSSKANSTHSSAPPQPSVPNVNIAWAEPPLYKVVAYDSSKDAISITTTSSNFSDSETPVSIPYAISQLGQTARFIPHLASLQNEGYQVIHSERDFLILRKVHKDSRSRSSRLGGAINPVDGTAKRPPIEPPTARFASPTGFVNYEPIFPPEPVSKYEDATGTIYDIPTHGRSTYDEQSFYPSTSGRDDEQIQHQAYDGRSRRERHGRWRSRTVWVASVAAGSAACAYVAGIAGELARPEKHVMRSSK